MTWLRRAVPAILIAFPLVACFKQVVSTRIRHPMHIGDVDDNRVSIGKTAVESTRGLPPGTLNDDASLSRLDAAGMCFVVAFRDIDTTMPRALDDYEVAVDVGEEVRIIQPDRHALPPEVQTLNGLNPVQVPDGFDEQCVERNENGDCNSWRQTPRYRTDYHPGPVQVAVGGGTLCFANEGYVTPDTAEIALVLKRNGQEIRFEWAFDSAISGDTPQESSSS